MILISPVDKDYYNGIIIEGHAETAPHGQDIVCAGVSGATFSIYFSMCYLIGDGSIDAEIKDGYFKLAPKNPTQATDCVIDGLLEFLRMTQEKYPNTISIKGDYNNEERL